MEEYFNTYYQDNCNPQRFTWFDSWKYPATVTFSLSTIIIPLHLFGAYCIVYKTSTRMKAVKWSLFQLHFWTSLFDLGITVLLNQMSFLPQNCGFSFGLLTFFGVSPYIQFFIGQCFLGMVASACVMMFENRHNAIVMTNWKVPDGWPRYIFYVFNYIAGTVLMLPPYFLANRPNQDEIKLKMLQSFPCPAPEFFQPSVTIFYDNDIYYIFFAHIQFFTCMSQASFFVIHTAFHLLKKRNMMSEHTRKLQLKAFKCVCLQAGIPFVSLAIPVFIMLFSVYLQFYNQFLTNSMVIFAASHGILSTSTLLYLYEPYRQFTRKQLRIMMGKSEVPDTPMMVQSVGSITV